MYSVSGGGLPDTPPRTEGSAGALSIPLKAIVVKEFEENCKIKLSTDKYCGSGSHLHGFFFFTLMGSGVTFSPTTLFPVKGPRYHLNRGICLGPSFGLDVVSKINISLLALNGTPVFSLRAHSWSLDWLINPCHRWKRWVGEWRD
jgi:hypothetical protein